jgi:hypothetical protein
VKLARSFLLGLVLGFALSACVRLTDTAVVVVNASKVAIVDAHDELRDAETQELERDVNQAPSREAAQAATDATERKFAPWWLRYEDVRLAWIAARATVEEAIALDAGHLNVDVQELVTSLAVLGQAWGAFAQQVAPQLGIGKAKP